MSEFIKTLTRKNSLRKHCQDLALSDIEKVIADLTVILEERREADEAEQALIAAKQQKIDEIRRAMQDAGLSMDDFAAVAEASPKRKVEAKYRITDENGTHEWSGRGRTPVAFQKYFDKHGVSKEDTLIK